MLGWACDELALDWSAARLALLAFTLVATFLFFYGLVILGAVMSFWTTESLEIMNTLTYGGVETAQYPMAIYQKHFRRFFTFVVPLAMVTYFPILAILDVPDPLGSTRTIQTLRAARGLRVLRRDAARVARRRPALHVDGFVMVGSRSFAIFPYAMSRYISITEAKSAPGLRLACLRGVPSPWTEAAKGIFHVKGLACQYAAQAKDEPDGALAAWAGDVGIPVVAYENEKLRTGWAEILLLAERLKPEPALDSAGRGATVRRCSASRTKSAARWAWAGRIGC